MNSEPFAPPALQRTRVFGRDDGSFDLTWPDDGAGVDAHAIPVHDGAMREIDTVAWAVNSPTRWWLARRTASLLGEWQLAWADFKNQSVHLYPTPEAWLAAVESGDEFAVCVLDWTCRIASALAFAPRIECADSNLAEKLRRTILEQSLPHFAVGVRAHA